MTYDYVIIGGGMSGAIAAGWLRAYKAGATVALIEPGPLGTSYAQGGLRYLRSTPAMVALLQELRVKANPVELGGGVLLPGTVPRTIVPFPGDQHGPLLDIQRIHYLKTRGTMDGFTPGAMNFGGENQWGLDCSQPALVKRCVGDAAVIEARATRASGKYVWVGTSIIEARKAVISTIPLPAYAKLLGLGAGESPTCAHRWLCVQRLEVGDDMPPFSSWSYTYTPWLRRVHRISPTSTTEIELEWNEGNSSDVRRDFLDIGVASEDVSTDDARRIPGHLLPIEWGSWRPPDGVLLLGRYASWDARATVDSALPILEKSLGQS